LEAGAAGDIEFKLVDITDEHPRRGAPIL